MKSSFSERVITELGYSPKQIREHLQSQFSAGMDWSNYGRGKMNWSVDHIRPVTSFHDDELISVINSLDNLRPLWVSENSVKGNKQFQNFRK